MAAGVPAWKKAGLKQVKSNKPAAKEAYDPLKEGLKRSAESGETKKPAKPPKRQKIKKSEKPKPTHEIDQLAYLRLYTESRDTWKFSKQKQNWILKHLFDGAIDDSYNPALVNYVAGLQGSARKWAEDEAAGVVSKWNTFMQDNPEEDDDDNDKETKDENNQDNLKKDIKKGAEKDAENESKKNSKKDDKKDDKDTSEKTAGTESEETKEDAKDESKNNEPEYANKCPPERLTLRARDILEALTGEKVNLELLV